MYLGRIINMIVYVRKVFPHDTTHEISVKTDIVRSFFENRTLGVSFRGIRSGSEGEVTINSATDPRFGGDFKKILADEGRADINDILLIYKKDSEHYDVEIVKSGDSRYLALFILFRGSDRHAFLQTREELKLTGRY